MPQPHRNWRREIDVIIETSLLAAGFERFDGISYSFHVSEEVLGLVHIRNQELGPNVAEDQAIINTGFGIIHYQLGQVLSKLEYYGPDDVSRNLFCWTLGQSLQEFGDLINSFDLFRNQSLANKEKAINDLVHLLRTTRVPYVRKYFRNLQSIVDYELKKKYQRNEQTLCTALVMKGKVAEARRRAEEIRLDKTVGRVNREAWPKFWKNLEAWIAKGAPIPSIDEARTNTLKSASERSLEVLKLPPEFRPTG